MSRPEDSSFGCTAPTPGLVQAILQVPEEAEGVVQRELTRSTVSGNFSPAQPDIKLYNLLGGDVGTSRKRVFHTTDDLVIRPNGSLFGLLEMSRVFSERSSDFIGLLSSKSSQRAGVSAATFEQFVKARPNYGLYFSNTAAASEVVFENPWVRAVLLQPTIVKFINPVLRAFNLPVSSATTFEGSDAWVSLSFFLAKCEFWKEFTQFLEHGIRQLGSILGEEEAKVVLNMQPRDSEIMSEAGVFSLLAEPLLMGFIRERRVQFKALKLKNPKLDSNLGFHGLRLVEMRKLILQNKDRQLYQCWLGYRNLYLTLKLKPDFEHSIRQIEGGVSVTFRE